MPSLGQLWVARVEMYAATIFHGKLMMIVERQA